MPYIAEGLRVLCDGKLVCTAVSDKMAELIAHALNSNASARKSAEERARFYEQNSY